MNNLRGLNGLILAGGHSQRMGHDKALLPVRQQPAYLDTRDRIKNLVDEVLISCRLDQIDQLPGVQLLPDFLPSSGPLTGIIAAFRYNPTTAWLVIPVDMPLLTEDFLSKTIVRYRDLIRDATVLQQNSGKFVPLPLILEASCASRLYQNYEVGIFSIQKLIAQLELSFVEVENSCAEIQNLNTLEDWKKAGFSHS